MLQLKSLNDIKGADAGWLKAKHHFAIGPYGNPKHMPVGNLIVFNDDEIAPHTGFGLHHHTNVEEDAEPVIEAPMGKASPRMVKKLERIEIA